MIPGLEKGSVSNGSGTQKVGGDAKSGNGDFSGGMGGSFGGPVLNKSKNGIDWKIALAVGGAALLGLVIWKKA